MSNLAFVHSAGIAHSLFLRRPHVSAFALVGFLLAPAVSAQTQFAEAPLKDYFPVEDGVRDFESFQASADFDADGDVDLLVGRTPRLWLNDGRGVYTNVTATHLPVTMPASISGIEVGDIDLDGDLDLILGDWNIILSNDGNSVFTDVTATALPPVPTGTSGAALGDIDGDGDPDLALGVSSFFEQPRLYLNDGTGLFTDVTTQQAPPYNGKTNDLELRDLDGDGALDLVLQLRSSIRVHWNDGFGFFDDVWYDVPGDFLAIGQIAIVDVDADADLDIAVANSREEYALFKNDGTGDFLDASTDLPLANGGQHVRSGDIDADGDPDLVLAGSLGTEFFLNDGNGVFAPNGSYLPTINSGTTSLVLEDLDGDFDLDVIAGHPYDQHGLLFNDGDANFTSVPQARFPWRILSTSQDGSSIAPLDFDLDGDVDLAIGGGGSLSLGDSPRIHENDGRGVFAPRYLAQPTNSTSIAAGDLNGDSYPDLVLANATLRGLGYCGCNSLALENEARLNDGAGDFNVLPGEFAGTFEETLAVALGDLDSDADLDIVFGNQGARRVQKLSRSATRCE